VTLDLAGLERWGERIGRSLEVPAVLALRGEIGAGKSVLARAIARGAGVDQPMPSPTFNLVLRYTGRDDIRVSHIDLFRLTDASEIWELGWADLAAGREIVLIEWPERAELHLPPDRWDICIEPAAHPLQRIVRATASGDAPDLPGMDG
jgi:tRNA threonylcarbamoyl adenosine modification protein YjeE